MELGDGFKEDEKTATDNLVLGLRHTIPPRQSVACGTVAMYDGMLEVRVPALVCFACCGVLF